MADLNQVAASTLPARLLEAAARWPDAPAVRAKSRGLWRTWSWREAAGEVGRLAAALAAAGVAPGDRVAVLGSGLRLTWATLALQWLGAVPVLPRSPAPEDELAAILVGHRIRHAIVAGRPEASELAAVRHRLPAELRVLCDDVRGAWGQPEAWLRSLDDLLAEAGPGAAPPVPGDPAAAAFVLFSAGTVGRPKPVTVTHGVAVARAEAAVAATGLRRGDRLLHALPLAWAPGLLLGPLAAIVAGTVTAYPEDEATVLADLREIAPTVLLGPPLLFRRLRRAAFVRAAASGGWRQRLVERAVPMLADGPLRPGPGGALARSLVLGGLKDQLGLGSVRLALSFGDGLPSGIERFLGRLRIPVRDLYTPAEAGFFAGPLEDAADSALVRLDTDGQILVRDGGDEERWHATGDIAGRDGKGRLRLQGRADPARDPATVVAAHRLETELRGSVLVRDACVVRDGDGALAALLAPDPEALAAWAQLRGVAAVGQEALLEHPAVAERLAGEAAGVNASLASEGVPPVSRIAVTAPLSVAAGELTAEGKLRRHATLASRAAVTALLQRGGGIAVPGVPAADDVRRASRSRDGAEPVLAAPGMAHA